MAKYWQQEILDYVPKWQKAVNSLKLIEEALFTVYLDSEYTTDHTARIVEIHYGNEDGNHC